MEMFWDRLFPEEGGSGKMPIIMNYGERLFSVVN